MFGNLYSFFFVYFSTKFYLCDKTKKNNKNNKTKLMIITNNNSQTQIFDNALHYMRRYSCIAIAKYSRGAQLYDLMML